MLNYLEPRIGRHLGIPGLIHGVILLNVLAFVLQIINPALAEVLLLDPAKVLDGQAWRLLSFILVPPSFSLSPLSPLSLLLIAFGFLFLWTQADGVEKAFGPFKLTVFYFLGIASSIAASFLTGQTFTGSYLNTTLFLAFATFFPDYIIRLFFIIPVAVKWLALLTGSLLVLTLLAGPTATDRLSLLICFANYLLFFAPTFLRWLRHRTQVRLRRQRFAAASAPDTPTLHRCATCGRTELSHPDLDFRVSSADDTEYCTEHLPSRKDTET